MKNLMKNPINYLDSSASVRSLVRGEFQEKNKKVKKISHKVKANKQ